MDGVRCNDYDVREQLNSLVFDNVHVATDEMSSLREVQRRIYTMVKTFIYNLLSITAGIVLSMVMAIVIASIQFLFVWILQPISKVVLLLLYPWAKCGGVLNNLLFGRCLSNLRSTGSKFYFGAGNAYNINQSSDIKELTTQAAFAGPGEPINIV